MGCCYHRQWFYQFYCCAHLLILFNHFIFWHKEDVPGSSCIFSIFKAFLKFIFVLLQRLIDKETRKDLSKCPHRHSWPKLNPGSWNSRVFHIFCKDPKIWATICYLLGGKTSGSYIGSKVARIGTPIRDMGIPGSILSPYNKCMPLFPFLESTILPENPDSLIEQC